jgi:uncharacterized protein YndB with AHSA1/START domain
MLAGGGDMARATTAQAGSAPCDVARTRREIVLRRVFKAPRHLVFDALTKPALLQCWLGPRGWSLVVCDIDLKVGGAYRFVARHLNGDMIGWGGIYREIASPRRLVRTECRDGDSLGEILVADVLTEQAGMTTLVSTIRRESPTADAVHSPRVRYASTDSYDRLAEFSVAILGRGELNHDD